MKVNKTHIDVLELLPTLELDHEYDIKLDRLCIRKK
jgi:hypothetical protein